MGPILYYIYIYVYMMGQKEKTELVGGANNFAEAAILIQNERVLFDFQFTILHLM